MTKEEYDAAIKRSGRSSDSVNRYMFLIGHHDFRKFRDRREDCVQKEQKKISICNRDCLNGKMGYIAINKAFEGINNNV